MGQIATVLDDLSDNLHHWQGSQRATTLHRIFKRFSSGDLWAAYRRYRHIGIKTHELDRDQTRTILGPSVGAGPFLFIWDVLSIADNHINLIELLSTACLFSGSELPEKGRFLLAVFDTSGRGMLTAKSLCLMGRMVIEVLGKCVPLCRSSKEVYAALRKDIASLLPAYNEILEASDQGQAIGIFETEEFVGQMELSSLLAEIAPAYHKLPLSDTSATAGKSDGTDVVTMFQRMRLRKSLVDAANAEGARKASSGQPVRKEGMPHEDPNTSPYREASSDDDCVYSRVDTPVVMERSYSNEDNGEPMSRGEHSRTDSLCDVPLASSVGQVVEEEVVTRGEGSGGVVKGEAMLCHQESQTDITGQLIEELLSMRDKQQEGILSSNRASHIDQRVLSDTEENADDSDGFVDGSSDRSEGSARREVERDVASTVARGAALAAVRSLRLSNGDARESQQETGALARSVVVSVIQSAMAEWCMGSDRSGGESVATCSVMEDKEEEDEPQYSLLSQLICYKALVSAILNTTQTSPNHPAASLKDQPVDDRGIARMYVTRLSCSVVELDRNHPESTLQYLSVTDKKIFFESIDVNGIHASCERIKKQADETTRSNVSEAIKQRYLIEDTRQLRGYVRRELRRIGNCLLAAGQKGVRGLLERNKRKADDDGVGGAGALGALEAWFFKGNVTTVVDSGTSEQSVQRQRVYGFRKGRAVMMEGGLVEDGLGGRGAFRRIEVIIIPDVGLEPLREWYKRVIMIVLGAFPIDDYRRHPTVCRNCGLAGHSEGQCDKEQVCYNCRRSGHRVSDCPVKERICRRCREPGHEEKDCRNLPRCLVCGKEGHWASECYMKDVMCLNCRKMGHKARDCPNDIVCIKCHKEGHKVADCPMIKGEDRAVAMEEEDSFECGDGIDSRGSSIVVMDDRLADRGSQHYCLNCKAYGHFARECPNEPVCNACGTEGHIAANCPRQGGRGRRSRSRERSLGRFDDDMCLNCKRKGHKTWDCPNEVVCNRCGRSGHKAYECREGDDEAKRAGSPRRGSLKDCYICGHLGHIAAECPRNHRASRIEEPVYLASRFEGELCYNCHQRGHLARDCRRAPICRICHRDGHIAAECPNMRGSTVEQSLCLNCRQSGHLARDCPNPPVCNRCNKVGHKAAACEAF
ncbi:hypothetical protein FOL47_001495 [Perkinsus chesapeaki]|uniref:CCHC-type domain-containing protein n=1 Tax=Perkinsus chesapeaki TaxID=330153 RepID=A0A7J6MIQ6_PERCH|nr:hypothetical protein FOL47_001495 [Perkinsus chesapeaki]